MILQSLYAYYQALVARGEIDRPGWVPSKISYGLRLNADGKLLQVIPLKVPDEAGKKLVPQSMALPAPVTRTVGVSPNFLWDNATYFLGLDSKGNPARALQCFEACRDHHLAFLQAVDSPAARAICGFFETWDPRASANHPLLSDCREDLAAGGNLIFMLNLAYAHEEDALRAAWQKHYDTLGKGAQMQCLVTGEMAVPATLHPSIKGVRGAQSSGGSLVAFNARAFESYNREQGANAPVSESAAFAYSAALNQLLGGEHAQKIGDATAVCWSDGGERTYQAAFDSFLTGATEPNSDGTLDEGDIARIFHAISRGEAIDWSMLALSPDVPFFVLGLSPNVGRLSVRFFLRDSFGAMVEHLRAHYERLRIVKSAKDPRETFPIWQLLKETVNPNSRDQTPSPQMAGDVLRAILTGSDYPATLYNAVELRIRAEREITRGRAAIIKAYLLKKYRTKYEEVATVDLNEQTTYQPYVLGRLFSVLEAIQQAANPDINTTIRDKFFSSACATPIVAFPHLIDLANKHLRKLSVGSSIYYEKQLLALTDKLTKSYPKHHTLEDQGIFQLGYYHQNQKRYEPKKKEEENEHV
ncbi:MAG: type I-C CRISPR-associated protein Cas8c/Csd1 [Clostridia bacterium]